MSDRCAIFLSGPIGAGKTTLGRALSETLGGGFIDADDYGDPEKRWYASIRSTCARIRAAIEVALGRRSIIVIAYPLRRREWIYFCCHLKDLGIRTLVVTLRASYDAIVNLPRGRSFSEAERMRIARMIAEGYADRPFSDAIVDTDRGSFDETVAILQARVWNLLADGSEG